MKLSKILLLSGVMMLAGVSASKASVYSFDFKSDDVGGTVANGALTVADDQSFDITGISGTVNGIAISGLQPSLLSSILSGFPSAGNKFADFSGPPFNIFLTDFAFADTNGTFYEIGNLPLPLLQNTGAYVLGVESYSPGTLSISQMSPVPLPAALPLFATAVLAVGMAGVGTRTARKRLKVAA